MVEAPRFDLIAGQILEVKQGFVITSTTLISLVVLSLLIQTIKSKKCRHSVSKQNEQISGRFFLISFIAALILHYTSSIICVYMLYSIDSITSDHNWDIILIASKVLYSLGRLIMEIYFIVRLYFIFGKTSYSIKKPLLWTLVIFSIIAFILSITGWIIGILRIIPYKPKTKQVHVPQILSFIAGCIGTIVSGTVIYLFIRNLYQTNIETVTAENIYHSADNQLQQDIQMDHLGIFIVFFIF